MVSLDDITAFVFGDLGEVFVERLGEEVCGARAARSAETDATWSLQDLRLEPSW